MSTPPAARARDALFLGGAVALLAVALTQYATSGENDWFFVVIAGEPALLAAYLWRAGRPSRRSSRRMLYVGLLLPASLVLAFLLFMLVLIVSLGDSFG